MDANKPFNEEDPFVWDSVSEFHQRTQEQIEEDERIAIARRNISELNVLEPFDPNEACL